MESKAVFFSWLKWDIQGYEVAPRNHRYKQGYNSTYRSEMGYRWIKQNGPKNQL